MGNSATDHLLQISSVLGLTGVGLGAIGAHMLNKTLTERGMLESWRTAILYQLFHGVAVLGVAALNAHKPMPRLETAGYLMGAGSVVFSGSIYMLCLGMGPKKIFGPATPVGGLIMMGGWGLLGFCSTTTKNE
mmetsp:Transcript_1592/g.2266  ORF Transcript_1592/g.2266 Transcript_1592/m.2266 type:complete len:133 (+) Transcript_1592:120-518(+)|eukprot:CAMPEP_0198141116 /NCGR_PEP_ID=MMETSP1443-20131203/4186_1 /TAXON_ID=186043 /ORGANISM="Entomoneis sp., Strain CCMP2396" /LENGTH=132 /DNA_ID=CAMNT_0043803763 /DNA_START=75 /DNA_END=473 /DNA_ORIENTATION=+